MAKDTRVILEGKLDIYYEAGHKGSIWAFYEEGKSGHEALHILKSGDILTVFNDSAQKAIVFDQEVDLEFNEHFSMNSQKDIDILEWGNLFKTKKQAKLSLKK